MNSNAVYMRNSRNVAFEATASSQLSSWFTVHLRQFNYIVVVVSSYYTIVVYVK